MAASTLAGRNFESYPQEADVVGVDISAGDASASSSAGGYIGCHELKKMDVTRLDFSAGSFDGSLLPSCFVFFPLISR